MLQLVNSKRCVIEGRKHRINALKNAHSVRQKKSNVLRSKFMKNMIECDMLLSRNKLRGVVTQKKINRKAGREGKR